MLRRVDGTGMTGVMRAEVRSHMESGIRGLIASRRKSVDVEAMVGTVLEGGEVY